MKKVISILLVCLMMGLAVGCAAAESDTNAEFFYPTRTGVRVEAMFAAPDIQPYTGEDGDQEKLDCIWVFYTDGTFEQFAEAEMLVSGIEQTTLRTNSFSPPLEIRIAGALEAILAIYGVSEETRKLKIKKVLAMDYRKISRRVLSEFKDFVDKTNEQAFEELFRRGQKRA